MKRIVCLMEPSDPLARQINKWKDANGFQILVRQSKGKGGGVPYHSYRAER